MNARIVVVEDQPLQLKARTHILSQAGYQVTTYPDGRAALAGMASHPPPDLILTDLNMPHLDGWSFCRLLRSPDYAPLNDTPVAVVSATFAGGKGGSLAYLGANAFLSVPHQAAELLDVVQRLLAGELPRARCQVLLLGLDEPGLRDCFASFGYLVHCCPDLQQATPLFDQGALDVVVAESTLPVQVWEELARRSQERALTVLALQASADPPRAVELARAGALVQARPFEAEYLVRLCEHLLQSQCLRSLDRLLEERSRCLVASENRYATLLEAVPDLVVLGDGRGQLLRLNRVAAAALGLPDDRPGRNLAEIVVPASRDRLCQALEDLRSVGRISLEVDLLLASGSTVAMELELRSLLEEGRRLVLCVARDLSEAQQAREAVRVFDTRFRVVAENTHDWEFWLAPGGRFLYSSPSCYRVTGYSAASFESDPDLILSLVDPADRPQFAGIWRQQEPADRPVEFEFRLRDRAGEEHWVAHLSHSVFDEQGNFLGFRGSHRDITEQRRAQADLARLAAAVENSPDGILIADHEGRAVYANPAYLAHSGLTLQDLSGRTPEFLFCDPPGTYAGIWERVAAGEDFCGRYQKCRPDGSNYFVLASVSRVQGARGMQPSYVWLEKDVTHEVLLDRQLRQAQKLEAVGCLAGGIAHEFNNLLGTVLGYASIIKVDAEPDSETFENADVIERTARRAADLTRKLLGFARGGKNLHEPVRVQVLLAEVEALIQPRVWEGKVRLTVEADSAPMDVMGDPYQLKQVLLSLVGNSCEAMGGSGGRLSLRAWPERVGEGAEARDYAVIAVTDDGCGIPPEHLDRIFDPFFTTREPGRGAGMGLAMAYGVVKNHGGFVRVDSQPGRGSDFQVVLPLAAASSTPPPRGRAGVPERRSTGRILVIEDEQPLRDLAARTLVGLGYSVLSAANGREGLEQFRQHHSTLDLVLLDMRMPEMDGGECFRRMKELDPEVPAVLCTGYSLNGEAQQLVDEGLVGLLRKPYRSEELGQVVAEALGRSQPAPA